VPASPRGAGRVIPSRSWCLEGDALLGEQLAQALSRDRDLVALFRPEVLRELADAPAGERLTEASRTLRGRLTMS